MKRSIQWFCRGLLLFIGIEIQAQHSFGPEIQLYPTGIIPGLRYEYQDNQMSYHLRAGYQLIDHRDLGVQDDETGTGYGVSIGASRYLKSMNSSLRAGLRIDYWRNSIDWETAPNSGTSEIQVIQPTLLVEYPVSLSQKIRLLPSLSFGYEINACTEGEPVGEGAIVLLGVSMLWH